MAGLLKRSPRADALQGLRLLYKVKLVACVERTPVLGLVPFSSWDGALVVGDWM